MVGKYTENMSSSECINGWSSSYLSQLMKRIHLALVLIVAILSLIMLGTYMSAFKLIIQEDEPPHSHNRHHFQPQKNYPVKLNKTFNEKNGGHTFVVESLAAIGNNLLASGGYTVFIDSNFV